MKIEQQRGISVTSSVMTFERDGLLFNLLDTSHGAPASGPGKTYVLENHQHFPHPPTSDGHREARMALNALQVQFDG
jgi:hypothetical protein